MRSSLPILLMLTLGSGSACSIQGQAAPVTSQPLTQISQVVRLSNTEAAKSLPVEIEGTVTFVLPQDDSLFIESNHVGVYVNFAKDIGLKAGDVVFVSGITDASFRPEITAKEVHVIRHGALPEPQPAKFEDLIKSSYDSEFIQISGRVLSAAMDQEQPEAGLRIKVRVPHGLIEGTIAHHGDLRPEDLLDAEVRITGVAGGAFDSRMQMAGVWLDINSWKNVDILRKPPRDPWLLPITPMENVVFAYRDGDESQRVRISGTLTYFEPASQAVLERNGNAILVETRSSLPLHIGMEVEATGFPEILSENVQLGSGQLRGTGQTRQVVPAAIQWEQASSGKFAYNLVSMEGEVVAEVHDSRVDLFVIKSDGHLFSATVRHSSSEAPLSNAIGSDVPVNSRVRIVGICFVDSGNHWRDQLWFDLRMRSLTDITVLQEPSWWTVKRLAYLISVLAVLILAASSWVWLLGQRLRRQTAVIAGQIQQESARERKLARQEQQRSHVLELISSPEPLMGVLHEITVMVSSRLDGVACWFELTSTGEKVGGRERSVGEAAHSVELLSPDGASLGFLMATTQFSPAGDGEIAAALETGARLGELAIDTRRLYSDLRHRSEHDLLTDIPNRFSLEKQLDQLMSGSRRDEGIFGLIYIDLDKFKQVNDRFGHRTGDLYLQEVTRRMKVQLRNGDVLARVGGDEFIALVKILRSRSDAEEIAVRLERCFDEPFDIDGYQFLGAASVGLAVYPEDGSSKEELQRFADAAMYAHKESKQRLEQLNFDIQRSDPKA